MSGPRSSILSDDESGGGRCRGGSLEAKAVPGRVGASQAESRASCENCIRRRPSRSTEDPGCRATKRPRQACVPWIVHANWHLPGKRWGMSGESGMIGLDFPDQGS